MNSVIISDYGVKPATTGEDRVVSPGELEYEEGGTIGSCLKLGAAV
jgi:hypothetical protein